MVDLIIPDSPVFPHGWMSLPGCELNYFWMLRFGRSYSPVLPMFKDIIEEVSKLANALFIETVGISV